MRTAWVDMRIGLLLRYFNSFHVHVESKVWVGLTHTPPGQAHGSFGPVDIDVVYLSACC